MKTALFFISFFALLCFASVATAQQCDADPAYSRPPAQSGDPLVYLANSCAGYSQRAACDAVLTTTTPNGKCTGQAAGGTTEYPEGIMVSDCSQTCDQDRIFASLTAAASAIDAGTVVPPIMVESSSFSGLYNGEQDTPNSSPAYTCDDAAPKDSGRCGLQAFAEYLTTQEETAEGGPAAAYQSLVEDEVSMPFVTTDLDHVCDSLQGATECAVEADFWVVQGSTFFHLGDKDGRFLRIQVRRDVVQRCSSGADRVHAQYTLFLATSSTVALPWTSKQVIVAGFRGASAEAETLRLRMSSINGVARVTLGTKYLATCTEGSGCTSSCCPACTYDAGTGDLLGAGTGCGSVSCAQGLGSQPSFTWASDDKELVNLDLFSENADCTQLLTSPIDAHCFGDKSSADTGVPDDELSYVLARYSVSYGGNQLAHWDASQSQSLPHLTAGSHIRHRVPPARDPCCADPPEGELCGSPCERFNGDCDDPCVDLPDVFEGQCDDGALNLWRFRHAWSRRANYPRFRFGRVGSCELYELELDDIVEQAMGRARRGRPSEQKSEYVNMRRLRWSWEPHNSYDLTERGAYNFTLVGRSRSWHHHRRDAMSPEEVARMQADDEFLMQADAEDAAAGRYNEPGRSPMLVPEDAPDADVEHGAVTAHNQEERGLGSLAKLFFGRVPFDRIELNFEMCPHGEDIDVRFTTSIFNYRWALPSRHLADDPDRSLALRFKMKHFANCRHHAHCDCDIDSDRDDNEGDDEFREGCPFFQNSGFFFFNDKPAAAITLTNGAGTVANVTSGPWRDNGFELRYASDNEDFQAKGFQSLVHDPVAGSRPAAAPNGADSAYLNGHLVPPGAPFAFV